MSAAQMYDEPNKRVVATTTPEGAKGWDTGQSRHNVPGGGHGRDVAPDAHPEGVRASTRRMEHRAGGAPSTAPTAANACPGCENYHVSRRQKYCAKCRRRYNARRKAAYVRRALAREGIVRRPGIAPSRGLKLSDSGSQRQGAT